MEQQTKVLKTTMDETLASILAPESYIRIRLEMAKHKSYKHQPRMRNTPRKKGPDFTATFEKGIFTFKHKERGTATYNVNNDECVVNGRKVNSLVRYFQKYYARKRYNAPWDQQTNTQLVETLSTIGNKELSKFIRNTFLKDFYKYTRCDYSNLGKILPFFKKFENRLYWEQEEIDITGLPSITPGQLRKSTRDLIKNERITLTRKMFDFIKKNEEFFSNFSLLLEEERIPKISDDPGGYRQIKNWQELLEDIENIHYMQEEHNYEPKTLLRYIFNYLQPYEGFTPIDALNMIRDYADLNKEMNITDFKRTPKYLKSKHDIIEKESKSFKKKHDEQKFLSQIRTELGYKGKKFLVVTPKTTDDVKREGAMLNHCVGSYIERIMKGETQILFLREEEEQSLVTLEVRGEVLIQAKGNANRNINKQEQTWIKQYCEAKGLLMRV